MYLTYKLLLYILTYKKNYDFMITKSKPLTGNSQQGYYHVLLYQCQNRFVNLVNCYQGTWYIIEFWVLIKILEVIKCETFKENVKR